MYILLLFVGLASATSLTSLACRNNCLRTSEDVCGTTPCINGCNPGWYGAHCSKRCSSECGSSTCHQYNGSCSDDNYLRSILKLNKRQSGSKKTSKRSLKNCLVSDEFHENKCKCCVPKYRGDNCHTFCEECRTIQTEGVCEYLCSSGFYGETCDKPCPETCKIGTYGRPVCKSVDRGVECSYGCIAGYYGDSCDRMCSDSCLNKACSQLDGSCLNCPEGYYGNDCTHPCNMKCVNERCHRNGTCIDGCKNDRFCNKTCPVNCQETNSTKSACNENNLVCLYGCKHGFFGDQCDKLCVTLCIECEKDTGDCLRCKEPWLGGKCDQKCVDNCDDGCYNNGTCRKCAPGYYGYACIMERKLNGSSKSTQGSVPVSVIVPCIILSVVVAVGIVLVVLRLKFDKARCLDRFLCGRCLQKRETTEEKRQRRPFLYDKEPEQERPHTEVVLLEVHPDDTVDEEEEKTRAVLAEVCEDPHSNDTVDGEEIQRIDAEVPVSESPHLDGHAEAIEIQHTDTGNPEKRDETSLGQTDKRGSKELPLNEGSSQDEFVEEEAYKGIKNNFFIQMDEKQRERKKREEAFTS